MLSFAGYPVSGQITIWYNPRINCIIIAIVSSYQDSDHLANHISNVTSLAYLVTLLQRCYLYSESYFLYYNVFPIYFVAVCPCFLHLKRAQFPDGMRVHLNKSISFIRLTLLIQALLLQRPSFSLLVFLERCTSVKLSQIHSHEFSLGMRNRWFVNFDCNLHTWLGCLYYYTLSRGGDQPTTPICWVPSTTPLLSVPLLFTRTPHSLYGYSLVKVGSPVMRMYSGISSPLN